MVGQRSNGSTMLQEQPLERINAKTTEVGSDFRVLICMGRRRLGGDGALYPWLRQNIPAPLRGVTEAARSMSELLAGGGTFMVQVLYINQDNQKQELLPRWLETIEGKPREIPEGLTMAWDDLADSGSGRFIAVEKEPGSHAVGVAPGPSGRPFAGTPSAAPVFPRPVVDPRTGAWSSPPESLVSPWARGYEPRIQWDLAADAYQNQWGVRPDLTPTGIAMQWTVAEQRRSEGAEVKVARVEERLETQRGTHQQILDTERQRSASIERRLAEMEAKHDRELADAKAQAREDKMQAQIESLKLMVTSGGGQKADTLGGLAPIVTALSPMFVEMVKGRSGDDGMAVIAKALLNKPEPKSALEAWVPFIGAMAPIAAPLLLKYLENMSPEARSDLVEKQQMQNQILLKQVWDMIQASQPHDAPIPWWLPPLEGILKEMMGLANTALIGASMRPPQQRQLPSPPVQQAIPKEIDTRQPTIVHNQPHVATEAVVDAAKDAGTPPPDTSGAIFAPQANLTALVHKLGEQDANAAMFTGAVVEELSRLCGEGKVDPLFLTPEWVTIIFTMHRKPDPDELASEIADHLEHCRQFFMLPQVLGEVFEKPELVGNIVNEMPVAKFDAPYAKALMAAIVEEVSGRETERKKVEAEDDESGETETPAEAQA